MTTPEDKSKVQLIPHYLRQETFDKRGRNTCYPTSILNAAIAVGSLSLEHAQAYHDAIVEELIAEPDLWNGSVMRIQTQNPRIAEVIEQYVPIEIGVDSEVGRLLTVGRSFEEIRRDLESGRQAHVVVVPEAVHAFAVVGATPREVQYIDPLDQFTRYFGSEQWFQKMFRPDSRGEVVTTPVRARQI